MNKSEKKIKPVLNASEKRNVYQTQMRRYNAALSNGFYFEALLIDYAVLEDRLFAFLYYIGAVNEYDKPTLNKRARGYLKSWRVEYAKAREDEKFSLYKISNKLNLIETLLLWTKNGCNGEKDKYLKALAAFCQSEKMNVDDFLRVISDIRQWCEYRNEIIHALMNKSPDSLNSELEGKVVQGMRLARYIDNQVKRLKRSGAVRKANNLKII